MKTKNKSYLYNEKIQTMFILINFLKTRVGRESRLLVRKEFLSLLLCGINQPEENPEGCDPNILDFISNYKQF